MEKKPICDNNVSGDADQLDGSTVTANTASHNNQIFILLCWLLLTISVFLFTVRLGRVEETSYDFQQDYRAAKHLLAGNSIYSDEIAQNNHPPFNAILFIPLALLNYKASIFAWSLLSIIFYFWAGIIVIRTLQIRLKTEWSLVLIAGALAWYPFQVHIALGQLSLFITICIIGAWASLKKHKDITAGVLIGIAALIKLYPLLIIGFLVLSRHWKAAWSALLVFLGGILLTWTLVGRDDFLNYFLTIAPNNGREYATFPINASLSAAAGRTFLNGHWVSPMIHSPALATIVYLAAASLVLLFTGIYVLKTRQQPQGVDIGLAMTCVGMLLVSPITWEHSFSILLLPFGLLLQAILTRPRHSIKLLFLAAVALTSLPTVNIGYALVNFFKPEQIPWQAGLLLLYPTLVLIFTMAALWLNFSRNNERA
jgi:hypothetical protein